VGDRSTDRLGAAGWRSWIPFVLAVSAFVGLSVLKGVDQGMSLTFAISITFGFVAVIAVIVVVGVRRDRRNDSAEVSPTRSD
jgi:ABC-type nickel/cobalt efflux system permease component RcnA